MIHVYEDWVSISFLSIVQRYDGEKNEIVYNLCTKLHYL